MYNITEIMTIEEAIDELELLKWQEGITDFIVTEKFSKTKEFPVSNLSIETESDFVYCWDEKGEIEQNGSILIGFLKEQLLEIDKIYDHGVTYDLLKFKNGNVTIKVA